MRGQSQLRSDRAEQMVFLPARLDDHFRLLVCRIRTRSFTCTGMRRVALGLRFRPRSIGASNLRTSGSLMKSLWIVSRDSCHSAATCFGVWNCSSAGYHLPEENFSSLISHGICICQEIRLRGEVGRSAPRPAFTSWSCRRLDQLELLQPSKRPESLFVHKPFRSDQSRPNSNGFLRHRDTAEFPQHQICH